MTADINIQQQQAIALARARKRKAMQTAEAPKEKGFFEKVGEDVGAREQNIQAIQQRAREGEINPIRSGIRQAGQAAGAYFDVAGDTISQIVPDFIEEPVTKAIGKGIETVGKLPSAGGGTIGEKIPQEWAAFKEKHPEAAADAEAIFNIGMFVSPVKGKAATSTVTKVGKFGEKAIQAGKNQIARNHKAYLDELVRPKQIPTVKEAQVGRTIEKGFFKRKEIQPSPREVELAKELSKIPTIERKNTLQGNYNILQGEVEKEANRLKRRLTRNDVPFTKAEFKTELNAASTRLSQSPLIVGDAEKTAEKILNKMNELVDGLSNPSVSQLLEVRKKLDNWVKNQKGSNIFDPGKESALSISLREIRQTTNNFIDTKATNVPVKKSLKRQSNLYSAMENIAPKAAEEAPNAIARLVQNTIKHVPLKNELYQTLGAGFGAVGAGTAAAAFPKIAMVGAGLYGAGKVVMSPTTKKALGELLKATDKTIRVTKDKAVLEQLRADRAVLLELVKNSQNATEPSQPTMQPENQQSMQQRP